MGELNEQSKFEIQPVVEQEPFQNLAVQGFFAKWCEINDSITPKIISREAWEQRREEGVLEKTPDQDSKRTLYLPIDLKLWEMVGVVEAVDHDTFKTKPERQNEKRDKLLALGKLFQNSGIYIAQRLDSIEDGKKIAGALAEEFYDYGLSLGTGKKAETTTNLNDIASNSLTPEETQQADRFLAGKNLYASRQARAEKASGSDPAKQDEIYEAERQKTLSQFFGVAQNAFELKQRTENLEQNPAASGLKPWQSNTPIHNAFLEKIERAMIKEVEAPKNELVGSIFRGALPKLISDMREQGWKRGVNSLFEKLGINFSVEQRKIADVLNITQLKTELENIRESKNLDTISAKEREIADKIQKAVGSFPYNKSHGNNPAEIVANQYINCVGASTLGGALMKEAGLDYLVGDVHHHSILFLVTSDGHIEHRDMLDKGLKSNKELTDKMIVGKKKDGSPLAVADIEAFSRDPKPEGLVFDIQEEGPDYLNKIPWIKEVRRQYVTVFEPEYGQQIQILGNTGGALYDLGRYEEAAEFFRQAAALNPKASFIYYLWGDALSALNRHEEAAEAYQIFIDLANRQRGRLSMKIQIKHARDKIARLKSK